MKRWTLAGAALAAVICSATMMGAAVAADPLKMAWVYVGPPGDGGWTFAHDQGRKAVDAKFGT